MTGVVLLPRVGDLLADKYRVLRVVADGGMGVVFEAHHELLGKSVALKFPLPALAHLPGIVERFLAEARLCARIENEHVVRVLDVNKLDGLPYIVMELLTGSSLAREMGHPWSHAQAVAYTAQVLDGLEAVHALGVVHRDVKPENIVVVGTARGPILKLIDFGIAKDSIAKEAISRLTNVGAVLGTPAYMAPEQLRDPLHAGSSVDLYSVGILLFEMLAGSSPFTATTSHELSEQVVSGKLRPLLELAPSTPPGLVQIVLDATALNAADRFASAREFKAALESLTTAGAPYSKTVLPDLPLRTVLADPPLTPFATPPSLAVRGVPPPPAFQTQTWNRVRVLASMALVVVLLTVAAVAVGLYRRHESEEETGPVLSASSAPETQIAPLASENHDAGSPGVPLVKRLERPSVAPAVRSEASAQALSLVQSDRRLQACNTDEEPAEVQVELRIAADGKVTSANAASSTASAPVTQCVVSECRELQFPPHTGAEETVRVPVQLQPGTPEPDLPTRPRWRLPGEPRSTRHGRHRHEAD